MTNKPKYNGGPAFPIISKFNDDSGKECILLEHGMSLRDFFAANAPTEPQPWFSPKMSTPRPEKEWVDDEGVIYDSPRDAEKAVGDDNYFNRNLEAQEEWDFERIKQRYIQWPWAWADTMLAERSKNE